MVGVISMTILASQLLMAGGISVLEPDDEPASTIEGYRLEIKPAKRHFALGEAIELSLRFSNIDRKKFDWWHTDELLEDFSFGVQYQDASWCLPTREGIQRIHGDFRRHNWFTAIAPGDSVADNVLINRVYDMSKPGTYIVFAWKHMAPRSGEGEAAVVHSNSIRVVVDDVKRRPQP